jgi:hypothetical protein
MKVLKGIMCFILSDVSNPRLEGRPEGLLVAALRERARRGHQREDGEAIAVAAGRRRRKSCPIPIGEGSER